MAENLNLSSSLNLTRYIVTSCENREMSKQLEKCFYFFLFFVFSEGGRLQQEIAYTDKVLGEGYGFTNELIIQTPKTGSNVLSQRSLLKHFQAVRAATRVRIEMYGL